MMMPGRSYMAGSGYRYGFNGKEKDNEVKGEGNQQDYGFRIYDPRLGRFLSVDPLDSDYPWYTPYSFAGNKPIEAIDLEGAEEYYINKQSRVRDYHQQQARIEKEMEIRAPLVAYQNEVVAMTDIYGEGHIGVRWEVERKVTGIRGQYQTAVAENMRGGLFGAVAYWIGGEEATFKGAALDQALSASVALRKPTSSTPIAVTNKQATTATKNTNAAKNNTASYVQETKKLQVGTYGAMTKANVGTGLSSDHIPSFASIKRNAEIALGRELTSVEARDLRKNTLTLVYSSKIHQNISRTFAGRNNPAQIALDAANLLKAIEKDIKALTPSLLKDGYSQSDINTAQQQLMKKYSVKEN